MATEGITVERVGAVVVAHLDDGKANALSPTMLAGIKEVVVDAEADASAGAVVLHGRPNVLSGGFDLKIIRGDDHAARANMVADGGDIVRTCYGAGLPVIAACTGHAFTIGALWLLACDTRLGEEGDYTFSMIETAMGMVLPDWALEPLQARLNPAWFLPVVTQSARLDPATAVSAGFLDQLVPPGETITQALETAGQLSALPGAAYAGNKLATRQASLDICRRSAGWITRNGSPGVTP